MEAKRGKYFKEEAVVNGISATHRLNEIKNSVPQHGQLEASSP